MLTSLVTGSFAKKSLFTEAKKKDDPKNSNKNYGLIKKLNSLISV